MVGFSQFGGVKKKVIFSWSGYLGVCLEWGVTVRPYFFLLMFMLSVLWWRKE